MKNKTILITGASSGIGRACAEAFAQLGANLILIARRLDLLNELKTELIPCGVNIDNYVVDVRDQNAVLQFVENDCAKYPSIDLLINNAGCALGIEPIGTASLEDMNNMVDVNIKGLMYFTHAIVPRMKAQKSGHIINIGSTASDNVYAGGTVYCATKHAVRAITKGLKLELVNTGIRVTEIDPGAVETEFSLVRFKGDADRAKKVYTNIERKITADEIADALVYVATRPAHINIAQMTLYSVDQAERLPM